MLCGKALTQNMTGFKRDLRADGEASADAFSNVIVSERLFHLIRCPNAFGLDLVGPYIKM